MKKALISLVSLLAVLTALPCGAQEVTIPNQHPEKEEKIEHQDNSFARFSKGENDLSIKAGIYGIFIMFPYLSPQAHFGYERCLVDGLTKKGRGSIGLGGSVGFGLIFNLLYIPITAKVSYHHQVLPKLDLYGSTDLGVALMYTCQDNDGKGSQCGVDGAFAFSAYAGANYFFTKRFALKAEIGFGYSIVNLGVNFRF